MNTPGKVCRLCRQVFASEDEFKLHWETHKVRERDQNPLSTNLVYYLFQVYNCDDCTYKCIKKSDLDIHRMCVHNSVRNFTCSECDKAFKTKQMLQRVCALTTNKPDHILFKIILFNSTLNYI